MWERNVPGAWSSQCEGLGEQRAWGLRRQQPRGAPPMERNLDLILSTLEDLGKRDNSQLD